MDTYTTNRIASLKETIEKAQNELVYLEASEKLLDMVDNTIENYCPALATYYKVETFKPFENFSMAYTTDCVRQVRSAINRYKSAADFTKAPTWAAKALKLAKIIDSYKD